MRVKFLPFSSFLPLEDHMNRQLLCLYMKAGVKGVEFLAGVPRSTAYRRLARLKSLGFDGEGLYVPIVAEDHTVKFLKRPLFLLSAHGCVYIPADCKADCLNCRYYPTHSRLINSLFSTPHLWPIDALDAIVEEAVKKLSTGIEMRL